MRPLAAALALVAALALLAWLAFRWLDPARESTVSVPTPAARAETAVGNLAPAEPRELRIATAGEASPLEEEPDGRSTLRFRPARGTPQTLEVLALDAASSAPVGGATVTVVRAWNGEVLDRQVTDASGKAAVSAAAGEGLVVTAQGYAPWESHAGQTAEVGELAARLHRPATLHGTVMNAAGAGRSGVGVRIVYARRALRAPMTTTDERGQYALAVSPLETFYVELADERGAALLRHPQGQEISSGGDSELDFRVGLLVTVRGRALDPAGVAIAGLNLCFLRSTREGPEHQWRTPNNSELQDLQRTGEDGAFAFDRVPAGRYLLGPRWDAEAALRFESVLVDGSGGDVERELVVWRDLYITGSVRQPDGSGAEGALVFGRWEGVEGKVLATCGPRGAFSLGPLVPGPMLLSAQHASGMLPGEREVLAGAVDVELSLAATGAVDVSVKPPSLGSVFLLPLEADGTALEAPVHTGIVFRGIRPGGYQVLVQTEDGRLGRAGDLQVAGGATVRATVELKPGVALRLHGDASMSGASVTLWDGADRIGALALAPDDAPAVIVPAGRPVRIELRAADGSWREEETFTFEPGATRNLVFAAKR